MQKSFGLLPSAVWSLALKNSHDIQYSTHIFFSSFFYDSPQRHKDTGCKSTTSTRHGGWIKFYMLGSFLIKMQAARLATFIKSITCKTLTPSSRPLKVHWKYWSFVALKSDSSSQHPIVSHLWLFPLSSLWHYFLLFPSACSNQANFVITTILPVNQDIIFETKLFFWFEKSVFVLWGIKWWLLSVHTLSPHWNIVTAAQLSSPGCTALWSLHFIFHCQLSPASWYQKTLLRSER